VVGCGQDNLGAPYCAWVRPVELGDLRDSPRGPRAGGERDAYTQLNLKDSADVLARFTALADRRRIPFGALLSSCSMKSGGKGYRTHREERHRRG
jgi:hypothetical protein